MSFFSALMDVLSSEDQGGGSTTSPNNTNAVNHTVSKGLACCNSFFCREESGGDTSDNICVGVCKEKWGGSVDSESHFNTDPFTNNELDEEKKHDEHNTMDGSNCTQQQTQKENLATSSSPTAKEHPHTTIPNPESTTNPQSSPIIRNPFDGWSGSTIKCATCHHIRPIRSTPFLELSLPIASIRSEFLEDFLAAEYGGFATAELVSDVQCFSCAIGQRIEGLEEEERMVSGAISSIQRRRKGKKKISQKNGNGRKMEEVVGLVQESQQIKHKIAILEALDPDADDDKLDCHDSKDAEQEMELGINTSLPPIVPLRGDAYKASLVMRPPEALCIHIQRRTYDMSCQRMVKVMRHVQFEEELDIRPYCAYDAKIPYKLMSVIEHMGNAFGGHYQTYRRVDPEENDWVVVSDESVSFRTWDDVRRCQAYMLFYVAGRAEPS